MAPCVFNKGARRAVLTCMNCTKCSFRKSLAELERGRRSARIRLGDLPSGMRGRIMDKYYPKGFKETVEGNDPVVDGDAS